MSSSYVARYLPRMRADYNLPNVMLVTFGAYYSESIDFIPISFAPRQGGKNSINVRRIIRIGLDALGDFRAFRRAM